MHMCFFFDKASSIQIIRPIWNSNFAPVIRDFQLISFGRLALTFIFKLNVFKPVCAALINQCEKK